MADIARRAGVARSTVSAILANSDYCYASEKTRQTVREIAQRMGYRPNYLARGLAGQRTNCIGLIVENIKGPAPFNRRIGEIEQAAWQAGYRLLVGSHCRDINRLKSLLDSFSDQRVDGLLVHHTSTDCTEQINKVVESGIPAITFDAVEKTAAPNVYFDREDAGYQQVKHLTEQGCRKLLFFRGGVSYLNSAKLNGNIRALKEAGLDPDDMHWLHISPGVNGDSVKAGEQLMRDALKCNYDFDGLVTIADALSVGAMNYLRMQGYDVPGDVKVVGLNNDAVAEAALVPMTTIRQPTDIGAKAARMLIKCIEDPSKSLSDLKQQTRVKGKLICRESTACLEPVG